LAHQKFDQESQIQLIMFLSIFWLVAFVSFASSATVSKIPIPIPSAGAFPFSKTPGQSSFIVQLKNDASLGKRSRDEFHKRAVNLNIPYEVQREFINPKLFYGLAITLNQNSTLSEVNNTLQAIPEVVAVYPNLRINKPAPVQSAAKHRLSSTNKPNAAIKQTWIPVDNSTKLPYITRLDTASVLKMADVDQVHALGIKGKGMKIAFVDTGVDYIHPSLGGGFGPGFKVAGGYAFVDDNWDGSSDPIPGPDPLTTCFSSGHGTHVTGLLLNPSILYLADIVQSIAGMLDSPNIGFGMTGVAPEASLYMYKVFSCVSESTTTDPSNTIVLVGVTADCPLGSQMSAASLFGIQYLIGYNVGQDPVSQDAELEVPFSVTTLVVDPRTGASMLRHIKSAGSTYSLSFTDPTAASVRMVTGGMLSNFSSFGPT
jgi:subtilisin family serine protease